MDKFIKKNYSIVQDDGSVIEHAVAFRPMLMFNELNTKFISKAKADNYTVDCLKLERFPLDKFKDK